MKKFEPPDLSWSGAPTWVGDIPHHWEILLPFFAELDEGDADL